MAKTVQLEGLVKTEPLWKSIDPNAFVMHSGDKWLTKFPTPADLWVAAMGYFEWCDDNLIYTNEKATFQGDITIASAGKRRVYTMGGLCLHIGISKGHFFRLRDRYDDHMAKVEAGEQVNTEDIADFRPVVEAIQEIIHTQRAEGAAVDEFNANFIARMNGMGEKIDHTSSDGSHKSVTTIELIAATEADADEEAS